MVPFNIISRDFPVTDAMKFEIEKHVHKLWQLHDKIDTCDLTISLPHKKNHKGRTFHIALKVHVPGEVLVVNREPELNPEHEDFHLALRDAFQAMKKRLSNFVSRQQGKVKKHIA